MYFKNAFLSAGLCVALVAAAAETQAQTVLADYTGSVGTDFEFGSFGGNVTPTADGLAIGISPGADTFGGTGTNTSILAMPVMTVADTLTVRAKLGPDNSSDFVIAFREASNEFFSYSVPASAFNTSTFEDYTVNLTDFFFNGDSADGVPNDSPIEVSFQLPFGGTGGADVIVQSLSTSAVIPEPTSVGLACVAGLAAFSMRRRK